jgi:FkbM family methyltransferase
MTFHDLGLLSVASVALKPIEVTDFLRSILSFFFLSKWLNKSPALKKLLKHSLRFPMRHEVSRKFLRNLAARHLLPLLIWRWLPVEHAFTVHLSRDHSFVYESSHDDLIGRFLFWGGFQHWEGTEMKIFYEIAQMSRGVLDIGANTGVYSLIACAANDDSRVTAFEPVPSIFEYLVRNLRLNGWEVRCEARCEAVSNYCGFSTFTVPTDTLVPTGARLAPNGASDVNGVTIMVRVTTADDACKDKGPIDLVKIDVEGFEDKVLEGMRGIFETSRPFLILEVVHAAYSKSAQEYLIDMGYEFLGIGKGLLLPVRSLEPDSRYRNILCVARGKRELLARLQNDHRISILPFDTPICL